MKKKLILTTFILLFLATFSTTVDAQIKPKDFSGVWTLDESQSKFPDGVQIESMTMKVLQTANELKIETQTKRSQNGTRSEAMRRGAGETVTVSVYNLDGKEATTDIGVNKTGKEIRKAIVTPDGKLSLTITRNLNDGIGNFAIKTNETWEFADAPGETLKVIRYTETPRGATNAEMYFKKSSDPLPTEIKTVNTPPKVIFDPTAPNDAPMIMLARKAINLVKPAYPAAARPSRARGAVTVKVTLDEKGDVISAEAISGDNLLREAAEKAAKKSKFSPEIVDGKPVKITGVIVYNFAPY